MRSSVAQSQAMLVATGFSAGEAALHLPDGELVWQVDAFRDGHIVLARGAAKRGLWSEPNPVPPWEWRASKRKQPAGAR